MIRVNVLYPSGEGIHFDMDYYLSKHTPMVRERLTPCGLQELTVDKGLAGLTPGTPATYIVVASLTFDSIESVQLSLGQHGAEILGDIPNYTNSQAVMQLSEPVV